VHIPKGADVVNSVIKENQPVPLGLVRFFDPAQAGIRVEAAKEGVRVKDAAVDKPFAQVGLKAGDIILTLGGTAVESPDSFRRLLRRKIAEGGQTVFKLRRGEKVLEIAVPLKD
jgi:S1-C subfamily serine protease